MSAFWKRQVVKTNDIHLLSSKSRHTTGGSGRGGARRGGGAGRVGTPATLSADETTDSLAHQGFDVKCFGQPFRTTHKRKLLYTDGGTKPAFDQRFIRGTSAAFRSWLLTSGPTPCLCKPFSCKAYSGIKTLVGPETRTYHGRDGTGRLTTGPRGRTGTGSTGRRQEGSPRRKTLHLFPRQWTK